MSLLAMDTTIAAEIEATYGQLPTFAGANSILASDPQNNALTMETADRTVQRQSFGHPGSVPVSWHSGGSFGVELAGAGAPGNVPGYGVLLRAAGMAETVTAGDNVSYSFVTRAMESLALLWNTDGVNHVSAGGRNNVKIDIAAKSIPMFTNTITSLYKPPEDGYPTFTPDYSTFQAPVAANVANTLVFKLDGYDLVGQSLSIDFANQIVHRNLFNAEDVRITGRLPAGQIVFEKTKLVEKDWYDLMLKGKKVALEVVHGTEPGNIVTILAPAVQLSNPQETIQDGVIFLQCDISFQPVLGNDELVIKVH